MRDADFSTLSGIEVEPVYGPADEAADDPGWTGSAGRGSSRSPVACTPPATAGGRGPSGSSPASATREQTNERYRMILAAGGGGLSVAFDMPTLMGRDSDDPQSLGEVGHCGVAIDSAADMETLFAGIDLGTVTTSMTISGPAVPIFCMYVVAAERQGVDIGTPERHAADRHLQGVHRPEGVAVPARAAPAADRRPDGVLRREIPAYKPLSVSGYHIREAGSTAAQELAFTLADGFGYVELGLSRGLDVDAFAPGLSFFFDAHIDFFEEIAKFRAARRIWARWMRDRYGATDRRRRSRCASTPRPPGVSLTAQQPYNNVVRTAVEALAAVLGGTNSLHTNALDETLALPTEESAEIALRTQQVLMEETGVANVADPLGGSWYVEALTDRIEAEAEAIFAQISELGGGRTGAPDRPDHLGPAARDRGRLVHRPRSPTRRSVPDRAGEGRQEDRRGQRAHRARSPASWRSCGSATRSRWSSAGARRPRAGGAGPAAVDAALRRLGPSPAPTGNLIPAMLDAARAEATLGEICDALRAEWGSYVERARF